ncbi:MAG: 8-oxoguanine DNA glycosylase [Methanolinea sp.]|nr:8-oxoguanine DNA glycosylase [Methanolinea sp.]
MPRITLTPDQPFSLDLSLSCGQVFSWEKEGGVWTGVVGSRVIRITQRGDSLSFSGADPGFIRHYFGLDDDLPDILSSIDRDPIIHAAIERNRGLRIIRQPPWECLASYICATYANIPGIKRRIFLLRQNLGDPVPGRRDGVYSFPSPHTLAGAEPCVLSGCRLGYRSAYLAKTARLIAGDPAWEERVHRLPYREAQKELLRFSGVGKKVADCVLLFAFGKWEAFPVDTWIQRIITTCYPDAGPLKTYDQISAFCRSHFGPWAGYAQEYLYCHRTTLARPCGDLSP